MSTLRRIKCEVFTPFDAAYWAHEAEALRIMKALKALGWVFWE